MANRRSRTDCDTYVDLPRDTTNAAPTVNTPIIPAIESSDPEALFKWARGLNLSLDEWFQILNQYLNDDTTPNPGGLYECYCLVVCDQATLQSCTSISDWANLTTTQLAWDYISRNWAEDVTADLLNGRFLANTYWSSYIGDVRYDTPFIRTASTALGGVVQTGLTFDLCEGQSDLIFQMQGTSGSSTFLNTGDSSDGLLMGVGDSITLGGLFRCPPVSSGRRTIFTFATSPGPSGNINGVTWNIHYNPGAGLVQYASGGNEIDPNTWVTLDVTDPSLVSVGNDWKHITVTLTRTDTTGTLEVWCNGVSCGSASQSTVDSGSTTLEAFSLWNVDDFASFDGTRAISFGYGGNSFRLGWNSEMIWTYFAEGVKTSVDILELHNIFSANFLEYVDTEGFNPQVGDVLVVQQILEDGTAVWCPEPKWVNGTDGQILYQGPGGPEDVYFDDPPWGLPAGGLTDQIIRKTSEVDGDYAWVNETRYTKTWENISDPAVTEAVVVGDFWVKP